mmetsp:Transcript_23076/g.75120  ORF Transcript_23076/g.75120 Transcript_23076/m.75120 type:complete len:99 (-) Transcript_23076:220-516(-)
MPHVCGTDGNENKSHARQVSIRPCHMRLVSTLGSRHAHRISLSSRTKIMRPMSSVSFNSWMARTASSGEENSTRPQPLDLPSGPVITSAWSTLPAVRM